MARAALFSLKNKSDAAVCDGVLHALRFMADDGKDVLRGDDLFRRINHVLQQRLAANLVKHLGQLRLQARAFAGSENRHCKAGWCAGFRGFGRFSGFHAIRLHWIRMIPTRRYATRTAAAGAGETFIYSKLSLEATRAFPTSASCFLRSANPCAKLRSSATR